MKKAMLSKMEKQIMKNPKKLLGWLFAIMLLFIILIIIGRELFIHYNIAYLRENPTSIPVSFSEAIQNNDYRMAEALTSPQLWPEIEIWLDTHEQVKCPLLPILTLGDEGQGGSVMRLSNEKEKNIYTGSAFLNIVCPDPMHYYCLEVTDIIVEKEDSQWMIREVGNIEEHWSEFNCN